MIILRITRITRWPADLPRMIDELYLPGKSSEQVMSLHLAPVSSQAMMLEPLARRVCLPFAALLMGVVVAAEMFIQRWLAILTAIVAVLAARSVGVAIVMLLVAPLPGNRSRGMVQGGILV